MHKIIITPNIRKINSNCKRYIVVVQIDELYNSNYGHYNGRHTQWIISEHYLLLIGYDEHYIFYNVLRSKKTYYRKSVVETTYVDLFIQSIVIFYTRFTKSTASLGRLVGDLVTGMADVTNRCNERNNPSSIYYNKTLQQVANMTIGDKDSSCNYTDFCCDFDAYKMSRYIEEATKVGASQEYNIHLFSDTLKWYYQTEKLHRKRFNWIFDELGCSFDTLRQSIFDKMNGFEEWLPGVGLLALKGNNPSVEVHVSCCYAFSQYISKMIQDL